MAWTSLWLITASIAISISPQTTTADSDYSFCGTFCPINSTFIPIAPGNCKRVVCFYQGSKRYKGRGHLDIDDIDTRYCTHIIYSFAELKGNRVQPVVEDRRDEYKSGKRGNYAKVVGLKQFNPALKVLLQVGYNDDSSFSKMIANKDNRREFIESAVTFLRKRGFDGIHLRFRKARYRGSPPEDKHKISLLCRELSYRLDSEAKSTTPKLLLTAEVDQRPWYRERCYDVAVLNAALDFIIVPVCGYHHHWNRIVRHHSPLYRGSFQTVYAKYNMKTTVKEWLGDGVDGDKLVVGLGFFSRSFLLDSPSNASVLAHADGIPCEGSYTTHQGELSYYEVCQMLDGGVERRFIPSQRVPYLVEEDNWVGYDDEKSLTEKVRLMRDNDLGGVAVYWLSFDDFSGVFCKAGKYPLLKAINDECSKPK